MPGLIPSVKVTDLHCLTSKMKYEQCLKDYDDVSACQHLRSIWIECLNDSKQAISLSNHRNHRKLRRNNDEINSQNFKNDCQDLKQMDNTL